MRVASPCICLGVALGLAPVACKTAPDKPAAYDAAPAAAPGEPPPVAGSAPPPAAAARAAPASAAPAAKRSGMPEPDGPALHFCDCEPGSAPGCQPGREGGRGTPSAPRRSIAELARAVAEADPGDRLLLCRGGAWTGNPWLHRPYADGPPVYVGAYGAGPAPLLRPVPNEAGINLSVPDEQSRYGNIMLSDLTLRGGGTNQAGVFMFRRVDKVFLRRLDIGGFGVGVQAGGGDEVWMEECKVHDSSGIGFLGGGNDTVVRNNRFDNNGFSGGVFGHNIYMTGGERLKVQNNHLTRSALDDNGACTGVSLNAHGGLTRDMLIEGNLIEETKVNQSCWGIAIDVHSSDAQGHIGARIVGNTLKGVGNVGIAVAGCDGCEISNNVVETTSQFAVTAVLAPRPIEKPPRPTRNLRVMGNRFMGKGGGACFDVKPGVLAKSDDNECKGLRWALDATLETWRERMKQDLKSRAD